MKTYHAKESNLVNLPVAKSLSNAKAIEVTKEPLLGPKPFQFVNDSPQVRQLQKYQTIADEGSQFSGKPLQLKKTAKPPLVDLKKSYISGKGSGSAHNHQDEKEKQRDDIWNNIVQTYNACVPKGSRNWNNLNNRIDEYYGNRPDLEEKLEALKAVYNKRYQDHYSTRLVPLGDGQGISVETEGFADKTDETAITHPTYTNKMNTEAGVIHGTRNYANTDAARVSDTEHAGEEGYVKKGLPNSELLWQQYFEKAKSEYTFFKESKATEAMKNITALHRENIANNTTQQVIFAAYPDGESWNSDKEWMPGTEEFNAILGTPNVAPAAFMLSDHIIDIGGKTIDKIKTTAAQNIEIKFKPLPKLESMEMEMVDLSAANQAAYAPF